jgi:Zn-dependent metalloprotease
MKTNLKMNKTEAFVRIGIVGLVCTIILTILWCPYGKSHAAGGGSVKPIEQLYQRSAPQFDYNLSRSLQNLRPATGEQIAALNNLKAATNSPNMKVRWNEFGGSIDAIYDFASQSFTGTPEEAGRAFIAQNAALFGVSDANNLRVFSQKAALGGYLIRFQQTFNDIPVKDGGIGLVMNANKQVVMASGPFFRNVAVDTQPSLSAQQARAAADSDLNQFNVQLPSYITNLLQTGLSNLAQQASVVNNVEPQLGIYPTADGYRLAYKVAKFSTNPFGLYLVTVDAHSGELLARKDFVNFQQAPQALPFTADVYPKYPTITNELKDQSIISNCNGTPCGQERVNLRGFDQQNIVSGINGTLTGTHALVNNALVTKQPFAQAALGTWHFRQDNPTGFEARTNEQDQFAEPAEHQDEINSFFFVTYLVEYVDYLHVAGDRPGFGEGDFPNDYPNKTNPLPATVHIPNIYLALDAAGGTLPDPQDPNLKDKVLGLDNAFALNLTSILEGLTGTKSPVVVNPTSYGHGFLLNDLALEGTVPYHEGMHAITSPIAGLEGEPEGGALNEGQADMWAFTITDNPSLGDYVVNAKGYRDRARSRGKDPDSIAYIRSARSTLKYSDIGTLTSAPNTYDFEEHYDGEIYMSTMWDIREMMNRVYPNTTTYKRPQPKDGAAQKVITQGTNIFERDFLGSMYVLGTTAPDTMVKARDAMIVADQMLYPTDISDPTSPGKNRAMIEQIFAAHELGVNALEVSGGQATISTQVTPFVGGQTAPTVPSNIQVAPASAKSLNVTWNGVQGAISYEILKRQDGFENARKPNGKRVYADGDASTSGFRHIAFVNGNQTSYEDKGAVHEVFAPEGLPNLFDSTYVVRAIGVNSAGQLGFSNLSGGTKAQQTRQDLSETVDSAISNITFANGVMSFDNKLTNRKGGYDTTDKTIYQPIEFQISNISNPTITVKNADANGNSFIYNQVLPFGATSSAKRLEFNDPSAQLFSFDARIYGNVFTGSTVGTGEQNGDGTSNPPTPVIYSIFSENKSGTLLAGDPTATGTASATWGNPTFKGITWDDIPVTTKSDALFLDATLSSTTAVDMDFDLLDANGIVLASSAGATAAEHVASAVQPNTTYFLRVKGFANGPSTYNIAVKQLLPNNSPNANAGTTAPGSGLPTLPVGGVARISKLVRFTVNPLTKTVTFRLL